MSKITLELENNSAEVLYGILVEHIDRIVPELKRRRVLNKDGSRKINKIHLSEYEQSLVDSLFVAETLYRYIEPQLESFKEATNE